MIDLTDREKAGILRADFLRRSYSAVDGLWFMRIENRLGFETALDLDNEVWTAMPKIQARMLKTVLGQSSGIRALMECLALKLRWEGHEFKAALGADGKSLEIAISECPWYRLMAKVGREHLAARVGNRICNTEYAGWAAEFGEDIRFKLGGMACGGDAACTLRFWREPNA